MIYVTDSETPRIFRCSYRTVRRSPLGLRFANTTVASRIQCESLANEFDIVMSVEQKAELADRWHQAMLENYALHLALDRLEKA